MGRAPCCEKMGLKKGPWTAEEDQILVNYIQLYGHGNWRALPKLAGLLRCGKSCRLRWTNYLRPDIKRGNFSREEEESIIQLHESLGNRWSAIAARLPGRTDNEIKNVWHTHLKKRLTTRQNTIKTESTVQEHNMTNSPMWSSQNESSSGSDATRVESPEHVPEMDDKFWSEVLSSGGSSGNEKGYGYLSEFQLSSVALAGSEPEGMEFWYDLFATASAGELTELPEI